MKAQAPEETEGKVKISLHKLTAVEVEFKLNRKKIFPTKRINIHRFTKRIWEISITI